MKRAFRLLIPALALLGACTDPTARSKAQPAPDMPQPTRRAPTDAAAMKQSFAPVVRDVAPAVVNVSSRRVVRQRTDPFWDFFMGGGAPRDRVEGSLGSGAIVRADGVVVTNHHNIEGMSEITVQLADRREFPATVLLDDPRSDLAVLKIDAGGERLPVLPIDDQEALQVGDLVLAVGNPFGVGQTVTNGIVSALARTDVGAVDFGSYVQTDAAINPGNSGGPLVDMDGDLVGINTFILSRTGASNGVGFAIPAAVVRQVVNVALGGGHSIVRPWLGARTQGVTSDIARSLGLAAPRGVLVADLYPGAAGDRAGLRQGDIILSVGGQAVNDEAAVTYAFGTRRMGETVPVVIRREGSERTLNVRAEAPPSTPARDERKLSGRNPLDGATVVNVSPAVALEFGGDAFKGEGVLVIKIDQGFAQQAGLRPGDVVREVNGRRINAVRDLALAVQTNAGTWQVTIQRGGQLITAQFRT